MVVNDLPPEIKEPTMQDLTNVHDHPAVLLTERRQEMSASILRDFESEKGLTFVALDNDALKAVQQSYEAHRASLGSETETSTAYELSLAVRDLLGMDD